jgi:hypothetical protein
MTALGVYESRRIHKVYLPPAQAMHEFSATLVKDFLPIDILQKNCEHLQCVR